MTPRFQTFFSCGQRRQALRSVALLTTKRVSRRSQTRRGESASQGLDAPEELCPVLRCLGIFPGGQSFSSDAEALGMTEWASAPEAVFVPQEKKPRQPFSSHFRGSKPRRLLFLLLCLSS